MSSTLDTRPARALSVLVVLALTGVLLVAARPAQADPIPGGGPVLPTRSPFTELQILPITGSQGVIGTRSYFAPPDFDPLGGYPASPPPGSTPRAEGSYLGLIPTRDAQGETVFTYCIDAFTSTQAGVTYERGEWNEASTTWAM